MKKILRIHLKSKIKIPFILLKIKSHLFLQEKRYIQKIMKMIIYKMYDLHVYYYIRVEQT